MSKSKFWCFTVNNYEAGEEQDIKSLYYSGILTYLVYGRECGSESFTPHLQGYLELAGRKRLRTVKQLPGLQRAHLELRRGTGEEAIAYCKKEKDFVEFGDPQPPRS